MIGRRVQFRPDRPYGSWILIGFGLVFATVALIFDLALVLGVAAGFLALGVALLLAAVRGFEMALDETSLRIDRPLLVIPYSSIRELRASVWPGARRPASYPIEIVHHRGWTELPSRASEPSERIYAFLRGRLTRAPRSVVLPSKLAAFKREQEASFGAERVFAYGPRAATRVSTVRNLPAVAAGLGATGASWVAIGALSSESFLGWSVAGAVAALCAVAVVMADSFQKVSVAKRSASLVVAPGGLAMEGGGVSGHLRWEEIEDVDVKRPFGLLGADSRWPIVVLRVAGAEVRVEDVFDTGIDEILDRILAYWK
jgi:hypothetical protein